MKRGFHESGHSSTREREVETLIWASELGNSAPTLDLHDPKMNAQLAELKIQNFIQTQFMQGRQVIRIIHGFGTGALEKVTRRVLEKEKDRGIVLGFRPASHASQAAMYAVLSKRR